MRRNSEANVLVGDQCEWHNGKQATKQDAVTVHRAVEYSVHEAPSFYRAQLGLVWPPCLPSGAAHAIPVHVEVQLAYNFDCQQLQIVSVLSGERLASAPLSPSLTPGNAAFTRCSMPAGMDEGVASFVLATGKPAIPTLEALRMSSQIIVLPDAACAEVLDLFLQMIQQQDTNEQWGDLDPSIFCTPPEQLDPQLLQAARAVWSEYFTPFVTDLQFLVHCPPSSDDSEALNDVGQSGMPFEEEIYLDSLSGLLDFLNENDMRSTLAIVINRTASSVVKLADGPQQLSKFRCTFIDVDSPTVEAIGREVASPEIVTASAPSGHVIAAAANIRAHQSGDTGDMQLARIAATASAAAQHQQSLQPFKLVQLVLWLVALLLVLVTALVV